MAALEVGELLHQKAAAEDAAQAEAARNAELQQQMAQVPTLCCHCCLHCDRMLPKDCAYICLESVLCSITSLLDRSICSVMLLLSVESRALQYTICHFISSRDCNNSASSTAAYVDTGPGMILGFS